MSVAQGRLIAGSNVSAVIMTMKLLHQYSKFLRMKLFKAKSPSPTLEIFNCISFKSCRNAEIQPVPTSAFPGSKPAMTGLVGCEMGGWERTSSSVGCAGGARFDILVCGSWANEGGMPIIENSVWGR